MGSQSQKNELVMNLKLHYKWKRILYRMLGKILLPIVRSQGYLLPKCFQRKKRKIAEGFIGKLIKCAI